MKPSVKRTMIAAGCLAGYGAFLAVWAFWWEPRSLRVRHVTVNVPSWNRPPLRIGLLADLHVGSPYNGLEKLTRIVETLNAQAPDVVLLLGDYVIQDVVGGTFVTPEDLTEPLGLINSQFGVYGILGNHDRWLDAERVATALEGAGVEVLENRSIKVPAQGGFWITGISDAWTAKPDITAALSGVADDDPVIAITHNPDIFPDVPGRVAITFAGHTHGGQVRLPIAGTPIVPSKYGARYAAGEVVENGRHLFVATGTGTSIIPVRFRVPPAVVILTLQRSPPRQRRKR